MNIQPDKPTETTKPVLGLNSKITNFYLLAMNEGSFSPRFRIRWAWRCFVGIFTLLFLGKLSFKANEMKPK